MKPPLFPAGEYQSPSQFTDKDRQLWVHQLGLVPNKVRASVSELEDSQLDTKYRNWTVRQIVHHLADSHVNCYVRFKWSLTEDTPKIKSYDETRWSELVDARQASIECSLVLLDGLHERWCALLRALTPLELRRGFFHPELDRVVTLDEAVPAYVWHAAHHLAQIEWLREQQRW